MSLKRILPPQRGNFSNRSTEQREGQGGQRILPSSSPLQAESSLVIILKKSTPSSNFVVVVVAVAQESRVN